MTDLALTDLIQKPIVQLRGILQDPNDPNCGPEEFVVFGAMGCFDEFPSSQIYDYTRRTKSAKKFNQLKDRLLDETAGRGHGAVLDQGEYLYSIKDLPRLVTMHICQHQFMEHLQQSMRRARAERSYIPESVIAHNLESAVDLLSSSSDLYEELSSNNIPLEDARFTLPLYAKTNIQTKGDARALTQLLCLSRSENMPSIVRETVEDMISKASELTPRMFKQRANNFDVRQQYPCPNILATKNDSLKRYIQSLGPDIPDVYLVSKNDLFPISEETMRKAIIEKDPTELSNLKQVSYKFLAKMSLVVYHHIIRHRTWNQTAESIYDAAERAEFIIPPSIQANPEMLSKFNDMNQRMLEFYNDLVKQGIPKQEAIGFLPHSLAVYDIFNVDGWNAVYALGKRRCTQSQWETTNIANKVANIINVQRPVLGQYCKPQCVIDGVCPERETCGKYKK